MKGVAIRLTRKSPGTHRKVKNLDGKNNKVVITGPKARR